MGVPRNAPHWPCKSQPLSARAPVGRVALKEGSSVPKKISPSEVRCARDKKTVQKTRQTKRCMPSDIPLKSFTYALFSISTPEHPSNGRARLFILGGVNKVFSHELDRKSVV